MTTQAPDALRLVPAEPTIDMVDAGMAAPMSDERKAATDTLTRQIYTVRDIYRAMLAASPAVQPAAGREEIARRMIRDAFISGRVASTTTTGAQDQADAEAYASERDLAAMFPPAENVGEGRRPMGTAGEVERLREAVEQAIRCLCTRIPGGVMHGDETMSVLRAALSAPQAAPGEGEQS